MYKFDKWDDILFGFNRPNMEDDWNDGQKFVLKDKRKFGSNELSSSLK